MVFKDGHYKVIELPEKLFVGPDMVYCGLPERERVFTLAYYEPRCDLFETVHLRRHDFGESVSLHPAKIEGAVFRAGYAAEIYIRYKPAPYQKVNQQTCNPSDVEVKGAKTRGRQLSIKDVSSINSQPSRGWDAEAPTSKVVFS